MAGPHGAVPACPVRAFVEPLARADVRRALPIRPRHVRLEVELDPRVHRVTGRVTHTVEAIGDGVDIVPLDAADLEVHAAHRDGTPLAVVPHARGVEVVLDPPLAAGEQAAISLSFTAHPSRGLYFIEGDAPQAWTQGAMEDHHHWFPCFDAPQHLVTTEVIATVPEGLMAVSNGEPVAFGEPADAGRVRFHWRHDTPHALYLLTLVVDALVCLEDDRGPVPIFHYVPPGREAEAKALFARLPQMLTWFGEATGRPYPYPRYGHVFLRAFMWGGMENTTLTSLTDNALVDPQHLVGEDLERLVVHELAHQWYGNLIAPRGWPQIWLNESLATYFELLGMQHLEGDDDFAWRLAQERASYLAEARKRYARPVVTRTYAHPYVLFDRHAYEKGGLVLHTLRDQIGDAAFWRGIRRYTERCAGTAAETADLRRAFEDESGRDLTDFFEQLVYTAGHPEVRVAWTWRRGVGVCITLDRLDDGTQALDLAVAVHARGATRRLRVPLDRGAQAVVVPSDHPPLWVAVDPDGACLVELDESRLSDAELRARLDPAHAPVALRMRTATGLGQRGLARNTEALGATLRDDPAWPVRAAAATALGQHRSRAARAHLLDAARDATHWRVRAAAGRALGEGADASWIKTIDGLLADEPAPRVRAALLTGLGSIRDAAARSVLRRHLDQPSPRECVGAAAIGALVEHEQPDVIDELMLRAQLGHARGLRQAAIGGLARLARLEATDRKDRLRIREALEGFLGDALFHIRASAIRALQRLGDDAARPALERAHGAERFEALRRLIREALGHIEAARAKAAPPAKPGA